MVRPSVFVTTEQGGGQTGFTVIDGGVVDPQPRPSGQRVLQLIGNTIIPYGYEAWDDGLFYQTAPPDDNSVEPSIERTVPTIRRRSLKFVATKPIWIRRFGRDMASGTELVELAYKDIRHNRILTEWVTRAEISDRRTVTNLAGRGLPANSGNAQGLVSYFERCLARNGQVLEWVDIARRTGAVDTGSGWGWLLGSEWIGPASTNIVPDPLGSDEHTKGYGRGGEEQAWFDKFSEIAGLNPIARWLCFSTFTAPLLRFIRRRSFIVHHWGQSGSGKTALAKFAMSAWGDAHILTQTFNRTEKSFTELFDYINDLPVCFDELQASTNEDHANIIYHLCLEKGRGRAKKSGGLHSAIAKWHSVVRMTGEEPIIGKGKINLGGQANRVVQLNAHGLTELEAGALHRWLEEGHFGWGGYRFLENLHKLIAQPHGEVALQQAYTHFRITLERDPALAKLQDRTGHLAAVALAQYLSALWLFGGEKTAAKKRALDDAHYVAQLLIEDQEQLPSTAEQALQIFRDHLDANASLWMDMSVQEELEAVQNRSYGKMFGILVPAHNEAWLVQGEANKLLQRNHLPPRVVWTDLKAQGLLLPADGRNIAAVRKCGKFRNRVYTVWLDKFYGDAN